MIPWHSDARPFSWESDAVGGASPDFGHRRTSPKIERRLGPLSACRSRLPDCGTPGSDLVGRQHANAANRMPNTEARYRCVVVALSGKDLTLAYRIGRKSARPGEGTIAPQRARGQTPLRGDALDLCVQCRPSGAPTHTFSIAGRRAERCIKATPRAAVAFLGRLRGLGRASWGAR